MIKLTRFALVVVLGSACGGGGSDTDGGPPPGPDAGPDAAAMALGSDALGAYAGAEMIARWEQADAQLYRINGDYLVMGGRECDPAVNYSFWTFAFISQSGVAIDVIYSMGTYTKFTRPENPEGKRVIPAGWFGSIEAIDYAAQAGYTDPPAGDPNYRVGMTFEMAPDVMITDPIWRLAKVYAPPGMPSMGENWLILYSTPDGGIVVCPPAPAGCVLL